MAETDAISREQFGQRLQQLLDERRWSQADLVRKVAEVTGQKLGRDAVSTYVAGRSFPSSKSMQLLCDAFGVAAEELLAREPDAAEETPSIELRMASAHPGKAWLRVNRLLTYETAAKIVHLINEEDTRRTTLLK